VNKVVKMTGSNIYIVRKSQRDT